MKKLYKGTYYHLINLGVESSSQYYISRENNIIRVKDGNIFEIKPKKVKNVKYLEITIANTYNPENKQSKRKLKTYNRIYASVFYKGKKFFAIMEIEGIPTLVNKKEYAELTMPRLEKYKGMAHDSNCKVKSKDLPKVKELAKTTSKKEIATMYSCSEMSINRALKRKTN